MEPSWYVQAALQMRWPCAQGRWVAAATTAAAVFAERSTVSSPLGTCTAHKSCGSEAVGSAAGVAQSWAAAVADRHCRLVLEELQSAGAGSDALDWQHRAEPAVLTGVAEAAGWDVSVFGRARMGADFGDARVKVFSPAQAALLQGQTARVHALGHVLTRLRDHEQLLYVFDPEFFNNATARAAAKVPEGLALKAGAQMLTLGGPQAGTQFHVHGPAFLLLLAGRKRWYLHRPGHFPNISAKALRLGMAAWEERVLPKLSSATAPTTCVQLPGETIFVPDSWAHATINLDETVGVAWQSFSATVDTCAAGKDYMCLYQRLAAVRHLRPEQQATLFKDLFALAEEMTGSSPLGLLRFLDQYQVVSKEGKAMFERMKASVRSLLKKAKPNTDDALLAAALTKALADAAFGARRDAAEASALLLPAVRKAPESGLGVPLAQLLAKQGRWEEAREQLEHHVASFPDDPSASTMLKQAKLAANGSPAVR